MDQGEKGRKDPEEQIKRSGKNRGHRQNRRPLTKPAAARLRVAAQLHFYLFILRCLCPRVNWLRGSAAPGADAARVDGFNLKIM